MDADMTRMGPLREEKRTQYGCGHEGMDMTGSDVDDGPNT